MQPREFLRLVVEPNVDEASADVSEVRTTYNAIMAVDTLAAHVFQWCKTHNPAHIQGLKDDTHYRTACGANHANVQMLHDLAKASKHVGLDRGTPKIKTFAEMQTRDYGWGEGAFGIGPHGGGPQLSVMVGGQKVQIGLLLFSTVDFYKREMDAVGIPA